MLDRTIRAAVHPVRLPMLVRCEEEPSTVAELASALELSPSVVRRHVRVLVDAHLLVQSEDGRCRTSGGWGEIARRLEALDPRE